MESGYIMIDCAGLDLKTYDGSAISGIYKRTETALNSGKLCLACNCLFDGEKATPIAVMVNKVTTGIACTFATLQLLIKSNDTVEITNFVAD